MNYNKIPRKSTAISGIIQLSLSVSSCLLFKDKIIVTTCLYHFFFLKFTERQLQSEKKSTPCIKLRGNCGPLARMPYRCVAYGCGKIAEDGVTLFKFPKDPEEFRKWEKQVQRTRPQWLARPNSHLCSDHFGKEYFEAKLPSGGVKLRQGAAPTVFVRPQCSCSGVGCKSCRPSSKYRRFTAAKADPKISVSSQCCEMTLRKKGWIFIT